MILKIEGREERLNSTYCGKVKNVLYESMKVRKLYLRCPRKSVCDCIVKEKSLYIYQLAIKQKCIVMWCELA